MSYPRGLLCAHHPHGKVGWVLEHSCTSHIWRAGSPWLLSKHSVSYCTWKESLTTLQGQPLLASLLAPGEEPGALRVVESPLATPQLLQPSVKGCSSPSSPQRLLPAYWLLLYCWLS